MSDAKERPAATGKSQAGEDVRGAVNVAPPGQEGKLTFRAFVISAYRSHGTNFGDTWRRGFDAKEYPPHPPLNAVEQTLLDAMRIVNAKDYWPPCSGWEFVGMLAGSEGISAARIEAADDLWGEYENALEFFPEYWKARCNCDRLVREVLG